MRAFLAMASVLGGCLMFGTPAAFGQGFGSLGGYGAASMYVNPTMSGGGGSLVIPYGGMYEGFMPSRMGGGSAIAFRPRPAATMGAARTSFSLSPMSGGMERGAGARTMSPFRGGGMGLGGMIRTTVPGGASVMPPSIGYPFRQPPSLLSPATAGAGMGM